MRDNLPMCERQTVGILGASGFIGSRLVEWLVLRDLAEVRPFVRSFRGLARLARFDLDCRIAHATNQSILESQMRGCQIVFHCVVGGRETILKSIKASYCAAATAKVRRLVYLSSAVVHGNNLKHGINDESEPSIRQPFEYNVSKALAEQRLQTLRQDGRLEIVILRPSIVFGPRSQYWTASIARDIALNRAYLVEGGAGICNTIYIDNLVHAMWLAATRPPAANHAFLLTDGEHVTWRDFYASIASALGLGLERISMVSIDQLADWDKIESHRRQLKWLKELRDSRASAALKRLMPGRVKAALRELIQSSAIEHSDGSSKELSLDRETTTLQQNKYVLPINKARSLLGYTPTVRFEEASQRTARWLRFASGMPVDSQ